MTVTGLNVHDLILMMEKEERLNAEMAELPMWNLWRAASLKGELDALRLMIPRVMLLLILKRLGVVAFVEKVA